MTGDERLRDGVRRAVAYTVAAQDPYGGGWRYRPGDPGDTSQLGWQFMALKSAELAGIPMPRADPARHHPLPAERGRGSYGGLASYRPGEQPTRTMTAEALVCWQFLGMPREDPASDEAAEFLLGQLPGAGRPQHLLLVLRHAGDVPVAGRVLAAVERGPANAIARPVNARRRPWPAPGTPTPPGAATAAGSTARRSRRSVWRSTTDSCRCTRRPRSAEKRGLPPHARRRRPVGTAAETNSFSHYIPTGRDPLRGCPVGVGCECGRWRQTPPVPPPWRARLTRYSAGVQ